MIFPNLAAGLIGAKLVTRLGNDDAPGAQCRRCGSLGDRSDPGCSFLWVAGASVETTEHQEGQGRPAIRQDDDGLIRGSLTLAEVEELTGVPVAFLKAELGLPDTISRHERLGRLRREHGFEMSAVREIIRRYRD